MLFRSVGLKLERPLLGWDIGTFEFTSDRIKATAVDFSEFGSMRLKLRTSGSTAKVGRSKAKVTEDGVEWLCKGLRMPIKHRYMSPVVIEFHTRGLANKAAAYSILWLPSIVDNETLQFNLPIYKADNYKRLTQNYIVNPETDKDVKAERVGELVFKGRFKTGLDDDHAHFLQDNDERETLETYEACVSGGLREGIVKREIGEAVEALAMEAYGQARDVDSDSDVENREDATNTHTGTGLHHDPTVDSDPILGSGEVLKDPAHPNNDDWSRAFGDDPAQLIRTKEKLQYAGNKARPNDEDDSTDSGSEEQDMGLIGKVKEYKESKRDLHRKHRGAMQWKPVRTMKAVKNQVKVGVVKAKTRFSMKGREPDIEVAEMFADLANESD